MPLTRPQLERHHCSFCGHKHLTAKSTRYIHQQADELLIIDDVPCLECDDCGEQYFDVLKAIEAEHTGRFSCWTPPRVCAHTPASSARDAPP